MAATHATQDGLVASIYVLLPVLAQSPSLRFAQVGAIRAVHGAAVWLLELIAGIASERVAPAEAGPRRCCRALTGGRSPARHSCCTAQGDDGTCAVRVFYGCILALPYRAGATRRIRRTVCRRRPGAFIGGMR